MKRLWIAAAILAVMLVGSMGNAWYSQSLSDHLADQLEQAQRLARNDDWSQAERLTNQAYDDWQAHHAYLHVVMRHSDTDEILRAFRSVLQYLDLQEMDQYAAANADLISQIQLLAEMEQISMVNVL